MIKSFLKKNYPGLFRLLKSVKGTDPHFLIGLPKIEPDEYHSSILNNEEGNQLIINLIKGKDPFLISRLGSAELTVILNYLFIGQGKLKAWDMDRIRKGIFNVDGVFPCNEDTLEKFSQLYLESIGYNDILAIWNNYGENILHKQNCPSAQLIKLEALEPFRFANPWSSALANKRVLIVHPNKDSIKKQFAKRDVLFINKKVLPSFDLQVYKPFNVYTDQREINFSWFDYLDKMNEEIGQLDFDIALVAAGPFGLPLAAAIKKSGRKAIHVGGALQLLFGIKGNRWEERPEFAAFMNEHWVKPSGDEVPGEIIKNKIDNSSYW